MTIRLLVVDDHPIIRESLQTVFRDTDVSIVAEAASGHAAVRSFDPGGVDVALVDLEMPDGDGFFVLEEFKSKWPWIPLLIHSASESKMHVRRSRELGASGYLFKGTSGVDLLQAIRTVHAGDVLWETADAVGKQD